MLPSDDDFKMDFSDTLFSTLTQTANQANRMDFCKLLTVWEGEGETVSSILARYFQDSLKLSIIVSSIGMKL